MNTSDVPDGCAILVVRVLYPDLTPVEAAEAVMPHHEAAERRWLDRPTAPNVDAHILAGLP